VPLFDDTKDEYKLLFGWVLNTHGVTRTVILTKKYAIKLPALHYGWKNTLWGLLANMQEASFSSLVKESEGKLCPVLFNIPGGWMTIQPRCEPMEFQEFLEFYSELKNWKQLDNFDIPCEDKHDSFGRLNGKIVCFDYGT